MAYLIKQIIKIMKPNIAVTISVATLLFLAVSFFIRNNKRTNRIKRDATIHAAKTDFLKLLNDKKRNH